ncbi:MAG: hypothetical protein K2V38_07155, partial [Gemmataceae bacterium]|nr:hypothetical protein [Gemmataceae bacterium]
LGDFPMLTRVRIAFAAALLAACAAVPDVTLPIVAAQDKDKGKEEATKAKAAALANMKKAGVEKPTVVETANFVIVGSAGEEKLKALGKAMEESVALARKTLKFDEKETIWKGKLTVYFMPENAEYKALMRRAFQQPPDAPYLDLRAELPLFVDPAELPGKPTDGDLYANTAARIAGEHLKAKGTGTQNVPDWLRDGFGRATAFRAEGTTSKRYQGYKTQARAALNPKGEKPPALAEVWGDTKIPGGDALGTSFAEYLAYGPGAAKFPMLIDGLKPTENNASPTFVQGLDAAGWKDKDLPALDTAWRKWALGK